MFAADCKYDLHDYNDMINGDIDITGDIYDYGYDYDNNGYEGISDDADSDKKCDEYNKLITMAK